MDEIFDLEKLKKEQEQADSNRLALQAVGSVAQGFADIPTSHELLYKGKSNRPDLRGAADSFAKTIADPTRRQAELFQAYKGAKEAEQYKKSEEDDKINRDPNSQRSKAFKAFAQARGMQVDDSTSAFDVMQMMDPKKLMESEADFDRQKQLQKMRNDHDAYQNKLNREEARRKDETEMRLKAQKASDPSEKLKALSGTDKARFDNALMVLKEVDAMGKALDDGDNTFSMFGDNNYTAAERKAAEAYGRMQSGGAINKDEEERFLAMLPRSKDSAEMQRKKLIGQRNEMISRLKTLGFSPEEAGYSPQDFQYGMSEDERDQLLASGGQQATSPRTGSASQELEYIGAMLEMNKRMKEKEKNTAGR